MKLNESENVGKELSETVTRVNNENAELKSENQKLKNRPPQTIIRYEKNCYRCSREEYEKAVREMEDDKKAAKENRDYFYRLVNNYNSEIDKRVDKIVKRKTRFQRFADWFKNFISAINSAVFFVPFLYAVGITILAICRNKIVRDDFIIAGKAVEKVFAIMFGGIKWLILKAAGLSEFIDDPTVQKILWWVILILLFLIVTAVILFLLFIASVFTYGFYQGAKNKLSKIFNKTYLAAMLADLGIITFCGDLIKAKTGINLVLTYFVFLAAFTVLKIVMPIILEKIQR